jgi:hypothetical protein
MYAVALRDGDALRLLCRIRRARGPNVYVLLPREEPDWNPHASYHRDGTRHVRSFDGRFLIDQRQPLDAMTFRGVEGVFALALRPGMVDVPTTPCRAEQFSEVFDLGREQFSVDEQHTLAVDLVEPGHDALAGLGREIVAQRRFREGVPEILVTLWRGLVVTLFPGT